MTVNSNGGIVDNRHLPLGVVRGAEIDIGSRGSCSVLLRRRCGDSGTDSRRHHRHGPEATDLHGHDLDIRKIPGNSVISLEKSIFLSLFMFAQFDLVYRGYRQSPDIQVLDDWTRLWI